MQNEGIVLESPAPLSDGGKSQNKIYIIATACGAVIGLTLAVMGGTSVMGATFGLGILGLLVGWGIKNKVLKYKSSVLRTMRFSIQEKPTYQELHNRLLPMLSPLNIKMEINPNGSICIPYDGLMYDVIFNEDNSFTVYWHQSALKAFLSQGYYISIYKKAVVAMGIIAYHVQKACQVR